MIPFLLAVNAAAVLLPVELQLFGYGDPFLPPLPKIRVVKRDAVFFPGPFSGLPYEIVFLVPAVEKSGGERVEAEPDGCRCRCFHPGGVTVDATTDGVGGDIGEEFLQAVFFAINNFQINQVSKLAERLQPSQIFLVGMDVVIVEKTRDLGTVDAKFLYAVAGAWRTAYMKEYFHFATVIKLSTDLSDLKV
jgi:hypothetical protein